MRYFTTAVVALAVGLGAAGAVKGQAGQKATGMDIPQPGSGFYMNAARQEMTDNLKRKQLAVKAANLINEGRCKEAYMVANEAMDTTMMRKIIEVCRAPKQTAAAPTTAPAVGTIPAPAAQAPTPPH